MPSASFTQQLRALILRDAREMLVNPVGVGYMLVMLLFVPIIAVILGTDDPDLTPLLVATATGTALSTLTTTPTTFILSEEWEHGTFLPMTGAGTSPAAVALARLSVSVLGALVHYALSFALLHLVMPGFSAECILPLTAACIPAAMTCSAVSLGLMLLARSQQLIYLCCAPVLTCGLVAVLLQPLLGIPVLSLLPMGPALAAALQLVYGIAPELGWGALMVAQAAWLAIALAVLAAGLKSFSAALAAERA